MVNPVKILTPLRDVWTELPAADNASFMATHIAHLTGKEKLRNAE